MGVSMGVPFRVGSGVITRPPDVVVGCGRKGSGGLGGRLSRGLHEHPDLPVGADPQGESPLTGGARGSKESPSGPGTGVPGSFDRPAGEDGGRRGAPPPPVAWPSRPGRPTRGSLPDSSRSRPGGTRAYGRTAWCGGRERDPFCGWPPVPRDGRPPRRTR